jgi:3,4-dihydroxy 2-butanone 4-phosphate synthase/GTP cyclohydrolase II
MEEAIEDLKAGKFVIVVDDEQRENEGDLVMFAEMVTPEAVNFAVTEARGLLCMPIIGERLDELDIPLMIRKTRPSRTKPLSPYLLTTMKAPPPGSPPKIGPLRCKR